MRKAMRRMTKPTPTTGSSSRKESYAGCWRHQRLKPTALGFMERAGRSHEFDLEEISGFARARPGPCPFLFRLPRSSALVRQSHVRVGWGRRQHFAERQRVVLWHRFGKLEKILFFADAFNYHIKSCYARMAVEAKYCCAGSVLLGPKSDCAAIDQPGQPG